MVPVGLVILEDRLLAHAGDDLERGGTHLGRDQLGPEARSPVAGSGAGFCGVPKTTRALQMSCRRLVRSQGESHTLRVEHVGVRSCRAPRLWIVAGSLPFVESIHTKRRREVELVALGVGCGQLELDRPPVVGRDDQEAVVAARGDSRPGVTSVRRRTSGNGIVCHCPAGAAPGRSS